MNRPNGIHEYARTCSVDGERVRANWLMKFKMLFALRFRNSFALRDPSMVFYDPRAIRQVGELNAFRETAFFISHPGPPALFVCAKKIALIVGRDKW